MSREEEIHLMPQVFRVHMDSDQWIVQIILENAVCTIQGTVEIRVDDEIIASDISRRAGAGLHKHTSLLGDEKSLFA
jgi:hypothetical protein